MLKVQGLRKTVLIKKIRAFENAIKLNCFDCMGKSKRIDCKIETCPLYPYRPWAQRITKHKTDKIK
jgi:hypothetical protein